MAAIYDNNITSLKKLLETNDKELVEVFTYPSPSPFYFARKLIRPKAVELLAQKMIKLRIFSEKDVKILLEPTLTLLSYHTDDTADLYEYYAREIRLLGDTYKILVSYCTNYQEIKEARHPWGVSIDPLIFAMITNDIELVSELLKKMTPNQIEQEYNHAYEFVKQFEKRGVDINKAIYNLPIIHLLNKDRTKAIACVRKTRNQDFIKEFNANPTTEEILKKKNGISLLEQAIKNNDTTDVSEYLKTIKDTDIGKRAIINLLNSLKIPDKNKPSEKVLQLLVDNLISEEINSITPSYKIGYGDPMKRNLLDIAIRMGYLNLAKNLIDKAPDLINKDAIDG